MKKEIIVKLIASEEASYSLLKAIRQLGGIERLTEAEAEKLVKRFKLEPKTVDPEAEAYGEYRALLASRKFWLGQRAEMAIREALKNDDGITEDWIVEIFKAEAHTAKNSRVWNAYGYPDDETENMDVWIEFASELGHGYIKGGAYLSDIWQTGGTDYREHMYIRRAEFV